MANEDGKGGQPQQPQVAGHQQVDIDEPEVHGFRRSGSASPSTFSTASSGSPLVRNLSASSGASSCGLKRPAATSIAAAQLQCQQQQIEFANQLAASAKKSSLSAKQFGARSSKITQNSLYSVEQQQQQQKKAAKRGDDSNAGKLSKSQSYADGSGHDHHNNKGFGYNLAKSIAFRAYSFNEFKSNSKLRYVNLACLLLTLVCLATILIFSGNNSGSLETAGSAARSQLYWRQQQHPTGANGNGANDNPVPTGDDGGDNVDDETSESIDSLNSQPLLAAGANLSPRESLNQMDLPSSSSQQQKPSADLEREFILSAEFERVPNVIDEPGSAATGAQQVPTTVPPAERQKSSSAESNSTAAASFQSAAAAAAASSSPDSKDTANRTDKEQPSSANGLLNDPFLNSTFTKSELRTLSKLLKRSHGKPVTIKSKSGATITMRSSSNFDGSQLSSIPSFIEKQLQLNGFKPAANFLFGPKDVANKHQAAASTAAAAAAAATTTTSTVGVMEAPSFVSRIRSSSFAALPPIRMLHHHHHHQPAELLLPEPISMVMAPMLEQMFRPSPLAMPSTLMRMIMRADGPSLLNERLGAANDDDEQQQSDDLAQATFSRTVILPQASLTILAGGPDNANSNASNTNEDTLASQQRNSTTTSPQQQHASGKLKSNSSAASPAPSSSSRQAANNSEVETFDVSQLAKAAPAEASGKFSSLYPSRPSGSAASFLHSLPHSSSMIIFGPGESGEQLRRPDHSAFHLSPFGQDGLLPFMAPPFAVQPQIMMFGAGSPNTDGRPDNRAQENPLYPILGSILNNVMADLSSLARNKEERTKGSPTNKTPPAAGENSSRAQQQQLARHQQLGSSLAPNWTAASASGADIGDKSTNMNNLFAGSNDEDWSSGAGDSDSWDEHAQLQPTQEPAPSGSKQLEARHREANGADVGLDLDSSGADASEIASMAARVINSRLFPSSGSMPLFGASVLSLPAGIVGGSLRQTIRGPGMTVERTIELPAARVSGPAAAAPSAANTSGPKSVAQQVGGEIRSQSLRRTDGGDSDPISSSSMQTANVIGHHRHHHHRPPFSPLGSLFVRHANDRSAAGNGGDEFSAFPMAPAGHTLGRILNDLAQQQHKPRGGGRVSIARSSPITADDFSDNLEEGDSPSANGDDMFAPMPTAPKPHYEGQVRVAGARLIMRPIDSSSHESGFFTPPLRFTMPDPSASSNNLERELSLSPSGSQEASERMMVVAPSFEDTLNSMEDRMNQVLSLSAQDMNSAAPSVRPTAASKPKQFHDSSAGALSSKASLLRNEAAPATRSIPPHFGQAPDAPIAAISRSDLDARLESSLPNQQGSGLSSISGNPFTSPSSPLFGFPTSSMASLLSDHQNKNQQQTEDSPGRHNNSNNNNNNNNKPNENTSTGSFRQRKSFTYHSNNEPAGANQQKQHQAELAMEDSNQQSVFAPLEHVPAALPGMIFGRRMDDILEQFRVPQQTDVFLSRRDLELEPMS